jgi:hypothetical protein
MFTGRKVRGSNVSRGREILLYSKTSRPALGPNHPPVQWVTRTFPEINRAGPEFSHTLPSSSKVMNEWSHTSNPETYNKPYGQDLKAVVHTVTTIL